MVSYEVWNFLKKNVHKLILTCKKS